MNIAYGDSNPARLLALGFSAAETARLAGVHRVTLWRYTTGREEPPERVRLVVQAVALLAEKVGTSAAVARVRRSGLVLQVQPRPPAR